MQLGMKRGGSLQEHESVSGRELRGWHTGMLPLANFPRSEWVSRPAGRGLCNETSELLEQGRQTDQSPR